MTIIAAREYREGRAVGPAALHAEPGQIRAKADRNTFSWVGLLEPTADEINSCAKAFGVHPLAVEDALHAHQLPKLEVYGDQLFVVARTAKMEAEHIAYGETAIFVGRNHIVTVRHGSDHGHSNLREKLEARPALLAHGVDYVLHALLDLISENYLPVIDAVSEIVQRLEQGAPESALSRTEMRGLFNIRREVLNSVMETSALIEQQRQGDITRKLASWAAILAVPTAIAGIYGMNFENMPELRIEYGYFIVMAAIAGICALLFWRFKKSGWL